MKRHCPLTTTKETFLRHRPAPWSWGQSRARLDRLFKRCPSASPCGDIFIAGFVGWDIALSTYQLLYAENKTYRISGRLIQVSFNLKLLLFSSTPRRRPIRGRRIIVLFLHTILGITGEILPVRMSYEERIYKIEVWLRWEFTRKRFQVYVIEMSSFKEFNYNLLGFHGLTWNWKASRQLQREQRI